MNGTIGAFGEALGKGLATVESVSQEVTKNVILKPAKTVVQKTNEVAVKPLQKAAHDTAQQVGKLVGLSSASAGDKSRVADSAALSTQTALPPDEQIMEMDILFTKMLANVSPGDLFNKFWGDKHAYESFFRASGKQDVTISTWEEGVALKNPYDEELYAQRRTVEYHFEKNILGRNVTPQVKTVEHARMEEDRCVITMSTDCDGVPFGDTFQVQLRWVGTRIYQNDLLLQLGLYVLFKKSVLVAGQIRSASRSESTEEQMKMFEAMKAACGAEESTAEMPVEENENVTEAEKNVLCNIPSLDFLRVCRPEAPLERRLQDDLDREIFDVQNLLKTLSQSSLVAAQRNVLLAALEMVEDSLDAMLVRKLDLEDTKTMEKKKGTSKAEESLFETSLKKIASPLEQLNSVVVRRIAKSTMKRTKKHARSPFLASISMEDKKPDTSNPGFDEGLQSMDLVVSKVFYNTSMNDLNAFVLARQESGKESIYEEWFRKMGMLDVKTGEWEDPKTGEQFVDPWTKESYPLRRRVSFVASRLSSTLAIQPDHLKVTETQYLRREPHKLVVATIQETSGDFYSHAIKVFHRLVIAQIEEKKLCFKLGIFVMFKRPVLLASKIRAGKTHRLRQAYTHLFQIIRSSQVGENAGKSITERYELKGMEEEEPSFFTSLMENIRRALPFPPILRDDPEFKEKLKTIRGKLQTVEEILADRDAASEDLNFYSGQLIVAREALDSVLTPNL